MDSFDLLNLQAGSDNRQLFNRRSKQRNLAKRDSLNAEISHRFRHERVFRFEFGKIR